MTAYAVFSMMGFYPVTPGLAEYQIGSPVFTKVTMHLDGGVDFVLSAPAATADAKYWEKATLGGKPLVGTVLPHAAILSGQTLKLEMHE
jgi:putative alpha-1,2-mannosidase